jgi:hypothetical protein
MHPPIEMGNPLSVPEDPDAVGYRGAHDDPEPLWLKLPVELALFFDLGFAHSEPDCPLIVLQTRDGGSRAVEVWGPPISFLGLAEVIASLCKSVPCIAHDADAEQAQRQAS